MPQHTSAQRRRTTVALFAVATLVFAPACAAEHSPSSSAPAAPQSDAGFAPSAPAPEAGPSMKDAPVPTEVKRDIVKTASMSITTGNPAAVADKAISLATDAGGRIDSRSEDAGSSSGRAHIALALRVPAAELEGTLDEFKKLGTVQTVEVRADDVTSQRVDLDARITALQTSVDRLLGIMRDAKDPDALIKAEQALSQRQADLDSLRAQRNQLGDQIDYSTVNLDITAEQIGGPTPQYQGFWGQVERGWHGLVSVASGVVMLFGLFLPWLAVVVIAAGIIVVAVRLTRSRPGSRSASGQAGGQDRQLQGQGTATHHEQDGEGDPVSPPGS
ncbi:hypothetical protein A5731_05340 [Mycolicibacterium conceptionense]|uniref:DUF4349 domain-containing protein n=2 Tax=Mycolicibacterium TaxID=1866885 RepID=A0A1A1ZUW5_9MYCO|nr:MULTISPECIES: DUF4349 domain-containing protein [Mycolicibacterium]MCW1823040.1 DUF4349 domain-containing protein [Mycolicibacterium senegalense]OBF07737.1 hypothetical protein A5731_05340 [Mycolicibacterium conceptionense]OBF13866.1 hypothetical protein A5726_25870 [Mycolicibacterium conceptionense]OBF47270.1 hypothetical protein A5720_05250 [Mycolicibacterium conceptionense]OBH95342.1 hypothetical protein A5716_22800 [Mycolicibacterium conceptionense]